jgi:hypothetical protein
MRQIRRMVLPLILAAILALTAAGCKHKKGGGGGYLGGPRHGSVAVMPR